VYLTVFLDDHSRYVVAWRLASRQTQDLVIEPLLEGIGRFGKPVEVLTDQGRQYYAWRGKSAFTKLLEREGIKQVVSRAHHPQTLGKCERLWKTVGDEFWDRAKPADLSDAVLRLGHFFAHYNHFRPHQGIDGAVPADRFFGAENALRETLEAGLSANELRRALDEAPRTPVYLFGQIGEQSVSVHGERGQLVVQMPDGVRRELGYSELGIPSREPIPSSSSSSSANSDERPAADDSRAHCTDAEQVGPDPASAPQANGPQADEVSAAGSLSAAGERAVEAGERGGAAPRAPGVRGDSRVLAGEEVEGRGGGGLGDAALAGLATQPGGAVGDAGGALEAAAGASGSSAAVVGRTLGRPEAAAQTDRGAGALPVAHGGFGARAAHGAVDGAERGAERGGGRGAEREAYAQAERRRPAGWKYQHQEEQASGSEASPDAIEEGRGERASSGGSARGRRGSGWVGILKRGVRWPKRRE
jgi:hypothetical protein